MKNFKLVSTLCPTVFMVTAVLTLASIQPSAAIAQAPDQNLASQLSELQAKVARLEAALNRQPGGSSTAMPQQSNSADMQGMAGMAAADPGDSQIQAGSQIKAGYQNCLQCHRTRPTGPLPPSHLDFVGNGSAGGNAGGAQSGSTADSGGQSMGGMGMDKGKMGGGMGMGMDKEKMGGGMGMMGGGMGMGGMDKGMSGGSGGMGMMEKMDGMMGMMEKMMGGGMGMGKMGGGSGGMGKGMSMSGGSGGMADAGSPPSDSESKLMEKLDRMTDLMGKMMRSGAMQPSPAAPVTGGMGGGNAPTAAEIRVMEKMDRMMDLMEKMIGGGGAMQQAQPMGMGGGMPMM